MPITRALSTRNRGLLSKRSIGVDLHETMDAYSSEENSSQDTLIDLYSHEMTPIKPPPSSSSLTSARRSFARTCSMPSITTTASTSVNDARNIPTSKSTKATSSHSMRLSLSSASSSAGSFCSSSRRSRGSDDSDEDDEDDRAFNARLARLGGCLRMPEAGSTRDDSNKENIAPLRRLSQHAIQRERATRQEDMVIRQTRRRIATPMSDRSGSQPPVVAVQNAALPMRTRSSFRRTVSSPSLVRKRSHSMLDEDSLDEDEDDASSSDQPSPNSRMRLDLSSDETASEFSLMTRENSSIFDANSGVTSPLSRCTTPDASDMDAMDREKDVESQVSTLTDAEIDAISSATTYPNVFVHARALLRYGITSDIHIVGRERERASLQRFLQKRFGLFTHLEHSAMPQGEALCSDNDVATESGSLYVCGLPGTGKTALVRSVLDDVARTSSNEGNGTKDKAPRIAFIDCMTIQHPRELFRRILLTLGENVSTLASGEIGDVEAEKRLVKIVKDTKKRTLIVLDEIDHLLRSRVHQNILYRLFSWPQRDTQACALIGMANSLDLTERFVPLLASKGAAPAVLHFRPFEAEEIKCVIGSRLAMLRSRYDSAVEGNIDASEEEDGLQNDDGKPAPVPLFSPPALELLARKIAAATGDLRKALDAARLAIEAVEQETSSKASKISGDAATKDGIDRVDLCHLTPLSSPKVMPSHILKIVSAVVGSPQLTKIRSLGLHAKLTLLALLVAQKRASFGLKVLGHSESGVHAGRSTMANMCASNGVTGTMMCDVESTYAAMLKGGDFATLEGKELVDVIEGLEVEGIVRVVSINGQQATSSSASTEGHASTGKGKSVHASNGPSVCGGVSPSAKRAAKRQLLASYRRVQFSMPMEDILRGITTVAPPARGLLSATTAATSTGECSAVVVDAIRQIWTREEDKAEHAKGWEASAALAQRVRDEELGGGRGALGI